jgi:recombination protein RecR
MNNLDKLIKYFEGFPGIGARQARRFAFHILTLGNADTQELSSLITNLKSSVVECASCHRFFSQNGGTAKECSICSDTNRDRTKLAIVERDTDIQAIERSGIYDGLYFVLGGTIPLLNSPEAKSLRSGALKALVEMRCTQELSEIILAFAVNPDGENTSRYVESLLKDYIADNSLKVSQLGRGLSTGSELEYADPETIKNALLNRH